MSIDKKVLVKSPEDWLGFFNRSIIWQPMLVFLLLVAAVLLIVVISQNSLDNSIRQTALRLSQEKQFNITSKLQAYELLAQGGAALARSGSADDNSWNQYFPVFNLNNNFPAIEGIGYASKVFGSDSDIVSDAVKIEYFYPQVDRNKSKIVENVAGNNDGDHAVVQAARTGQTTMTDMIELDSANEDAQGFILFAPVYNNESVSDDESERLRQFKGVVYVIFNAKTIFDQVYNVQDSELFYLSVYHDEGEVRTTIYETGQYPSGSSKLTYSQNHILFGQQFVYEYEFSNKDLVPASQRLMPSILLLIGIGLALLISVVMSLSLRSRNQRLSIIRERDAQEAKDELLSIASHQLRTPATGVKQYIGMVVQGFAGEITDKQRDLLEKAYASNERQLHIINDILHLAKLEAGQIVLSKTKLNLVETINSVVDELSDISRTAKVKLTVRTPKKAMVMADAHMFRMVLENLVTNAIKYTNPKGKVTIKLTRAGEFYKIAVSDTGVGIAARDMSKLFKQFSRIPNERSSKVTGTGVGLYLSKSLMKLHDGDITVSSDPEAGSVFTIILPRGL